MKKQYKKEFDYGRQLRNFCWSLYKKAPNVKILSQDFDKTTNKHVLVWCYK